MQAILFDRSHWDTANSRKWMSAHGYKPIKRVHETDNYLRYRLQNPSGSQYRIIRLGRHIKAIVPIAQRSRGGSLYSIMASNHDLINGIVGAVHAIGSLAALAGIGYAIKRKIN